MKTQKIIRQNYLSRRSFLKISGLSSLALFGIQFLAACTNWRYLRKGLIPESQSLKQDVIILGSGITGLCVGAILSHFGYKVTVLEAHKELIGGHARSFEINGLSFCAGPQYVWNFNPKSKSVGSRVLRLLHLEDENPFLYLDRDCFEEIYLGEKEKFSVPMGLDKFSEKLTLKFPKERENILNFFDDLDLLFRSAQYLHDKGLYLENSSSMIFELFFSNHVSLIEKFRLYKLYDYTLGELFERHSLSEQCRRILYGHGGVFAENYQTISVGVYAAATGYYHSGATYPQKGFDSLINSLTEVIKKNKGEVLKNKRVVQATLDINSKIQSVLCEDNSIYKGDIFISTLSPRNTCKLLGNCSTDQFDYEPSNSLTGIFIGLKDYTPLSKLSQKNFWWQNYPKQIDFENPKILEKPDYIYISSATANGIQQPNNHEGLQALTLFIPGSFKQSQDYYKCGETDYRELKKIIFANTISRLEELFFPNISDYILFEKVLTPMDIFEELSAEQGNVYGRRPDPNNVLEKIQLIDGVENLFLANATVGQPGVATAFQTATVLVEKLFNINI